MTLISMACGCSNGDKPSADLAEADIVAQYRDTVLRMSDVMRMLPPGITAADSANLARSIIDQWINGFLIEDLAASQIDDIDRIDRLVSDYRRSLIADSYRRKMRATGVQPVNEKGISEYYRLHKSELILERPVIKGLFIKVPASSRSLDDIRRWMKMPDGRAYDELENIGRKEPAVFRFFADRWVDFDAITDEIPYRFEDYDRFVEENTDFETEHNGSIYMLHISDFRHTGNLMPEEYASPLIEDRIKNNYLAEYESGLVDALRRTAIQKNILIIDNNNIK
ncbi:MAG: hypothetical protein NC095_10860 [Muribaculum sp.]|nr:hypothetical protein [Muribaculum sp.]